MSYELLVLDGFRVRDYPSLRAELTGHPEGPSKTTRRRGALLIVDAAVIASDVKALADDDRRERKDLRAALARAKPDDLIREVDTRDLGVRDKLAEIASFIVESYRHDPDVMKVIIVEVTRAANSFGRTHLDKIREAYGLIGEIVAQAQAQGEFRSDVTPQFAALAFYGAIEQVLTGWIFSLLPAEREDYERAKAFVVQTVCEGLDRPT